MAQCSWESDQGSQLIELFVVSGPSQWRRTGWATKWFRLEHVSPVGTGAVTWPGSALIDPEALRNTSNGTRGEIPDLQEHPRAAAERLQLRVSDARGQGAWAPTLAVPCRAPTRAPARAPHKPSPMRFLGSGARVVARRRAGGWGLEDGKGSPAERCWNGVGAALGPRPVPVHTTNRRRLGGRVFNWRGGVDTARWLDPPSTKKGSTDGPPKIIPRLTPGPWRWTNRTQNSAKNENGIFGISSSRGFRKSIICHVFGEKKIDHFQCSRKNFGAFGARLHNI